MFGRVIHTSSILWLALACAGCDDEPWLIMDYSCAESGLDKGSASISGFPPLDAFFGSVLAFGRMSNMLSRTMAVDLQEIKAAFQISDEQVAQAGSLAAALETLIEQSFAGNLKIQATPARCAVDPQGVLMAELTCKALAECEVDSEVSCGTCHGENARDVGFKMPNGLAPLNVADFPLDKSSDEDIAAAATFMAAEVVPAMAALLEIDVRSAENPMGFGCFGCHARAE